MKLRQSIFRLLSMIMIVNVFFGTVIVSDAATPEYKDFYLERIYRKLNAEGKYNKKYGGMSKSIKGGSYQYDNEVLEMTATDDVIYADFTGTLSNNKGKDNIVLKFYQDIDNAGPGEYIFFEHNGPDGYLFAEVNDFNGAEYTSSTVLNFIEKNCSGDCYTKTTYEDRNKTYNTSFRCFMDYLERFLQEIVYCELYNVGFKMYDVTLPRRPDVERVFGKTRYETAISIAEKLREIKNISSFSNVVVASGEKFPDALAGSYLAIKKNAPVLLVGNNGTKSEFSSGEEVLLSYLEDHLAVDGNVYILGGSASVSDHVENEIKKITNNVKRIYGKDRYETNLKILEEAGTSPLDSLLVCDGSNYADSLSASALGRPILLVDKSSGKLSQAQKDFLLSHKFYEVCILGGTSAVPDKLQREVNTIMNIKSSWRLYGSDRYETSYEVASHFMAQVADHYSKPEAAMLAIGSKFPDGLSGGPLAYALSAPMLLVDQGETGYAEYFSRIIKPEAVYAFGGKATIPWTWIEEIVSNLKVVHYY